MSQCDYRYFGDVMSFDSTYRTNAYNWPLVIFVEVNHHTKMAIFRFGLLVDETMDTYSWILQTFLEAMHGKCLISVVTDDDKTMSKAGIVAPPKQQLKDDFDSINKHPVLVNHLIQLEKQAAKVYTRYTFAWVSDKIKSEAKLSIVNCVDDMDNVMHTFKKFDSGDTTWNVRSFFVPAISLTIEGKSELLGMPL
ncbi:hypothetical protein Ddye_005467 [Dipteronia dyeriana]|uniref:MULE transposase domain-containing protein n=1 Tax=Dipteronia dyeriana TaxID=168575 RepID=A0AAD9XGE4_9ROSI|nr:hypothetical protein Ddye_005467 [Dipteronia dyeriana]